MAVVLKPFQLKHWTGADYTTDSQVSHPKSPIHISYNE